MGLFGKKGRGIITDKKIARNDKVISDDDIARLQYKTNLLIRVSKYVTIAVMVAMLLYLIVWERDTLMQGNFFEQLLLVAVSVLVCGVGANALTYHLVAKRMEGSFWTAYRQQYLVNMVSGIKGIGRVTYKEQPGLSYEELRGSVLVRCQYDRLCRTQDCLYGDINGDDFRITNFKAGVPIRKANGYTGEKRIFDGLLAIISADDEDRELLRKVGFMQVFSASYSPTVAGYTAEHEFKTGDEEFDAAFKVFAEKPNKLGTFFDDSLKAAIRAFVDTVKTPAAFSFNGGSMFIAVNDYPDIFEAKLDVDVVKQKNEVMQLMNGIAAAQKIYDIALDYKNA